MGFLVWERPTFLEKFAKKQRLYRSNRTPSMLVESVIPDVVLCKNHHTKQSLDEVLEVLKRNKVRYTIFNFVPENITDEFIDKLLDRIEGRDDNSSHLKIDEEHSRKRARQLIVNGFVKKYEEPTDPFIRLDSFGDVKDILKIITTYYFMNINE